MRMEYTDHRTAASGNGARGRRVDSMEFKVLMDYTRIALSGSICNCRLESSAVLELPTEGCEVRLRAGATSFRVLDGCSDEVGRAWAPGARDHVWIRDDRTAGTTGARLGKPLPSNGVSNDMIRLKNPVIL
ncbi:hypothetical protein C8Q76DRAFT_177660 [Earliella scabrosa]|nr:hypothetical protein C8Q76DRAFT_177660 [Earliella scabrosa]